jgi:hypothetical protein
MRRHPYARAMLAGEGSDALAPLHAPSIVTLADGPQDTDTLETSSALG